MEEELTCAVCLQVYQDPVSLPCQHCFCLKCIEDVWAQAACPGEVNCPQCRSKFNPRPRLEKNFTLCNIVEKYNQSQAAADCTPVMCEYCIENPSPAVKTCLKCETSFCSLHLKPHLTKETYKGHTLIEPIADLTKRQCLDHKKVLEFYCEEDEECVCVSCTIIGKHKSHTMLSLDQAETKIKKKLKNKVKKLHGVQKSCSIKQQDLEKSEAEIKTLTNELKGNLSKKFSDWRKQLEEDEEYTLKKIDEAELRVISQIRSCSESLAKKMEQIKLIDVEARNQLQRDCLSFLQDSKQLLSRISQLSRLQDTVAASHVNKPSGAPKRIVSGKRKFPAQLQLATRATETQNFTLNLTNVPQLIKKRMEKSKKYQKAILQMIKMGSAIPPSQPTGIKLLNTSPDEEAMGSSIPPSRTIRNQIVNTSSDEEAMGSSIPPSRPMRNKIVNTSSDEEAMGSSIPPSRPMRNQIVNTSSDEEAMGSSIPPSRPIRNQIVNTSSDEEDMGSSIPPSQPTGINLLNTSPDLEDDYGIFLNHQLL